MSVLSQPLTDEAFRPPSKLSCTFGDIAKINKIDDLKTEVQGPIWPKNTHMKTLRLKLR